MGQRTIKNKFTISSAFPVHKYSEKAGFYADLIIKYLVSADYFLKKKTSSLYTSQWPNQISPYQNLTSLNLTSPHLA